MTNTDAITISRRSTNDWLTALHYALRFTAIVRFNDVYSGSPVTLRFDLDLDQFEAALDVFADRLELLPGVPFLLAKAGVDGEALATDLNAFCGEQRWTGRSLE